MILENIEIVDAGAEGMAVGRTEDKVIFVPFVVPGDVVDVQVVKKRRRFLEGKAVRLVTPSPKRVEPHCAHFGLCGGCRWQSMSYAAQLYYKQKQVYESLVRIGKIDHPGMRPILPSPETRYYRNKLDFTFSNHRWLTADDMNRETGTVSTNALGFHIPQFFDKVVDIRECFHMRDPVNAIRNEARRYALEHGLSFYDVRIWQGLLRNLIVRNTNAGGLMVILVVREEHPAVKPMLEHLHRTFPEITSLFWVINPKRNDTIYDLEFNLYTGDPYITEKMAPYRQDGREITYRIGPVSFFQTNSRQAEALYRVAAEFAGFRGGETLYDLYTGTGTIACYAAPYVGRVVGIESVSAAVADAEVNARLNGFSNCTFVAGETEKVLTPEFIEAHGKPDILITDPPRAGMHEKVVSAILAAAPPTVVYVSCNPATQARDLALMNERYLPEAFQPVDMFPHTHHVENVALLKLVD